MEHPSARRVVTSWAKVGAEAASTAGREGDAETCPDRSEAGRAAPEAKAPSQEGVAANLDPVTIPEAGSNRRGVSAIPAED